MLVLIVLAASGCSIVAKVRNAAHNLASDKATIDAFATKMQSDVPPKFEVTYTTTGSSPARILYAVDAPTGLAFMDTPSGSNSPNLDVVVNSSGEYVCSPASGSGSGPSCQRVQAGNQSAQNQLFGIYTPAHWSAFLKGFALAAGLAGDKITSSTMTINGFAMSCVDFNAPGVAGRSTVCTTTQGMLGYVNVASDSTSFEITSFTTSPPPSLFELPPGAKVTTIQASTTT